VLYLPLETGETDKLCIYFHGNCEDIGSSFECLNQFGAELRMHMMAIEYPGYGLYKQSKPSELKIKEDCESVYDYLTQVCGVQETNIVLWGRSLGTGPCTYLATIREPHSILLMSGFTSIRDTAKDVLGKLGFLNTLVDDIFPNLKHIAAVRCPVFLMHGVKDTLIPYSHSQKLKEACQQYCYFNLVPEMDHNTFNFTQDLMAPF
jgi:abhydrolase domain-containing protein 17